MRYDMIPICGTVVQQTLAFKKMDYFTFDFSFNYLTLNSSLGIFIIDSLLCHAVLVICKTESEGTLCEACH
jgi:hypothetical protein